VTIVRSQTIASSGRNLSSANVLFANAVSSGDSIIFHVMAWRTGGVSVTNVQDNWNAGNYTLAIQSTRGGGSTDAGVASFYKVNISTGAGASTYRVSVNFAAQHGGVSLAALDYSGIGDYSTAGGAASGAAGSGSSSPTAPVVTSTAGSVLFSAACVAKSTGGFRSSMAGSFVFIQGVDTGAGGQIGAFGEYITSSLDAQAIFRCVSTEAWAINSLAFVASTTAGTAGVVNPWVLCLGGVQ
jgi:hypothetical protein